MLNAVIIIPTYNEEQVIASTIKAVSEACATVKNFTVSILIFDSHSTDATINVVRQCQGLYPNIYYEEEEEKRGLGHAYMQAMRHAVEKMHADVVIEFDADGSHQPQYLPKMLDKITAGADVVVGSRYVAGGSIPADWGSHRRLLSIMGNRVARLFLSPRYCDWTSGFRATKTSLLKKVDYQNLLSTGYAYKLHLFWLLHKLTKNIEEMPIEFIDRKEGYSKLPKNNIIDSLAVVIRLRYLEMKRFFTMCLMGLVGFIIQVGIFNVFRHHMLPQFANAIAVEFAIITNFLLNNKYTFKAEKSGLKQLGHKLIKFNGFALISILLQTAIMSVGVHYLGRGFWTENALLFSGVVIAAVVNYFNYSRFVWLKTV